VSPLQGDLAPCVTNPGSSTPGLWLYHPFGMASRCSEDLLMLLHKAMRPFKTIRSPSRRDSTILAPASKTRG
jgi:hypothetical protein